MMLDRVTDVDRVRESEVAVEDGSREPGWSYSALAGTVDTWIVDGPGLGGTGGKERMMPGQSIETEVRGR